jgi:hypothetical protein
MTTGYFNHINLHVHCSKCNNGLQLILEAENEAVDTEDDVAHGQTDEAVATVDDVTHGQNDETVETEGDVPCGRNDESTDDQNGNDSIQGNWVNCMPMQFFC